MSAVTRLGAQCVGATYALRRRVASEETFLARTLQRFASPGQTLLEVGCGFCRFEPVVSACGLAYTGVEKNEETLARNRSRGIPCLSPEQASAGAARADVLLLAHIIEHFDHETLVEFLNRYLEMVPAGGYVVILTPVLHRGFYDDFDHVRPYNPAALRQVFSQDQTQTREFGVAGRFEERDFWVKRDSLWHSYRERRWMHLVKVPLSLLTTMTLGRIGRTTGYGIVFEKIGG